MESNKSQKIMGSHHVSNNSRDCDNFDDDIFGDSTFLENIENLDFKNTPNRDEDDATDFNISALCCDEELIGYDKLTGQRWIYPTNYSVRDYQFNIIKAAMLENCLVSLPTGLGKTFIAAVIMYNFYRWYPLGKIIFTAPTRPLVAQQIDACYNIVAMPPKDTIEMTGQMHVNTRKVHWQSKRVFFATPQVVYNDIKSGMCPGDKIRCLVFDEAHKARGNYAYGNIISTLSEMGHKIYRVLALSATPGNKVEDVIHVVKHLHISHLELRTENCLDVKVYSHARKINTVVVELGPELTSLRQQYVEILDGYNRKLKNFNIVQNLGNLSKGRIIMLYKEFQSRERGARHPQHNYIMRTFTLLITLYHGLELLVKHGARVFLNFFDEHPEKTWVQFDKDLTSFFDKLRDQLGVNPLSFDRSILPDGTIPEIPSNLNFGHPKFDKLKEIMLEHFNIAKQNGQETKAIVFCEYRESVNLVHCLLLQCRPTIMPEMFVGHGSGKEGKAVVSQKQQLRVMRKFRAGWCNTLVCTCVAEEGLDVGAVDLIVCFDVSTRSPVRLVQRCGRTGRERNGQVFILVTEGREHTTLLDCMRQNDGLNKRILQSEEVKKNLYKFNPRMLPRDFMPECQKMFITVKKELNEKPKKSKEKAKEKLQKGQQDLRSMFLNKASSSKIPERDTQSNDCITKEEYNKECSNSESDLFSQPGENSNKSKESLSPEKKKEQIIKPASCLELQRKLQDTSSIGHSSDAKLLKELSQHKHEITIIKSPAKKDGDIRVLFSKTTKSIKNYTKSMKELGINNNMNISTEVLNLLVDISLENTAMVKRCYICLTVCNCSKFSNRPRDKTNRPLGLCSRSQPVLPDINLIDSISSKPLLKFANDNINIQMGSNKANNNNLSESRSSLEYSSNVANCSKIQNVEIVKNHVDNNTGEANHINTTGNQNVCEDDCLFMEDEMFDNIDMPIYITPTESKAPKTASDNIQTIKIIPETTMLGKIGNNNNNSDIDLENDTIIIESQERCVNEDIFEDNDDFESIDILNKLTPTKSRPPQNPSDDIQTIQTIETTMQGFKLGNNNNNANIELENDTIIIESPEMSENDDIFEDSDVLDDIFESANIRHTETRAQLDNAHRNERFPRPTNKDTKKLKVNSNEIIELERDIEDIGNQRINENDDIFEDDDIFDDIEIQNDVIPTKSTLQFNDVLHNTNRTSESTIQNMEDENDIYTVTVLKYFRLNKISDLFQNSDVDIFKEERANNKIGKKFTHLPKTGPDYNERCNDNNQINVIPVECPSSPSLLSGRSISERSTSPILISQKRKLNLSVKTRKNNLEKSSLTDYKRPISVQEKLSISSLTEPEHRKTMNSLQQDTDEIIVLDSDDENFGDDTIDYKQLIETHSHANTTIKRKFQEEPTQKSESPYFRKKLKLNENFSKPSTIKEKIVAALTSHENDGNSFHNNTQINFMTTKSPTFEIKKENKDPLSNDVINKKYPKCNIDMLEIFQHETNNESRAILNERSTNVPRQITYNDDDDDFKNDRINVLSKLKHGRIKNSAKRVNSFLDVEAELSQEGSASADERSDDSAGSLVDFICDDAPDEDIHDIYLQSVKSPVKGIFKVPQLPPLNKAEVFSQYVEEDTYEMDSFCVDSHMILNETNEMSELELAEMILKEKRRSKKSKNQSNTQKDNEGSPIIRKNHRNIKRRIESDSEDSS